VVWNLAGKLGQYNDAVPTYIRSMFPAFLRRLLSLNFLTGLFDGIVFALRWIVVPALLLPFAFLAADLGFRGWGRAGVAAWKTLIVRLEYWVVVGLAAGLGVFLSQRLVYWTPRSTDPTLAGETVSLILRLSLAYLLALFSWMLVCSMIGRSRAPRAHAVGDPAGEPAQNRILPV
jgi:hypothetical protein